MKTAQWSQFADADGRRHAGSATGQFIIPPEFDDPLPEEIQAAFEGRAITSSLDEILAPARAQFAASGLNEEAFDQLFEEERQSIWETKNKK